MNPGARTLLAVVIAAALGAHAQNGDAVTARTPAEWLRAMDDAFRTLDYDGVFSYYAASHAQQMDIVDGAGRPPGLRTGFRTTTTLATFRIVHMVVDGIERERIVHLNGPPREILRTGDDVAYKLQPGDALLDLEGATATASYGRVFARRFEGIADHYDIAVAGQGRVAGRPATHLEVVPRDTERLAYRLMLDDETGLLLRSELHDPSRANLEIFQFTSLLVGDAVDPRHLASTTEGATIRRLSTGSPVPVRSESSWRAGWVPAGFELTSANTHRPPSQRRAVSMMTFSDGLAAFSVFVEAMPETGAGHVVSRSGATVALTHLAASETGDHLVTVVGEVPVATARRIAASVDRKPRTP